ELARLYTMEAELHVRSERNAALVRLAETRSGVANDIRRRYESLERQGVLPSDKRLAAIDNEYRSRADLEAVKSELTAMRAQLKRIAPAVREAEKALQNLTELYGHG